MAGKTGQIVHAVIVPKGTDPAILKEIYGDNWPDEMPDAMAGDTGTSVTYVLNQKSEFATLSQPKDVTLKDGKTKIQVVTGDLKPGKTKADGILDLPDPLDTVEQENVVMEAETIACSVDDELWKLGRLVWTSLAMSGATPDQRLSMVTTGISVFQAFMTDLLNQLGQQQVDGTVAAKSDMGKYGVGDMFHRVLGEIRGLKKAVADSGRDGGRVNHDDSKKANALTMPMKPNSGESQHDFLVRCMGTDKAKGMAADAATAMCNSIWHKNGQKEDTDMGEITREEFDGLKDTVEGFSKKFAEFLEKSAKIDAATDTETDGAAAKADKPKTTDELIMELSAKFDTKLGELDAKISDTAAKTDALQKAGKSANVVEDPTKVNGKKSDCTWSELPQFKGR